MKTKDQLSSIDNYKEDKFESYKFDSYAKDLSKFWKKKNVLTGGRL